DEYATLWIEEATCVWFETIFQPSLLPEVCNQHIVKPFRMGMPMLRRTRAEQEKYGYGMATLLHELVTRQVRNDMPKKLWQNIQAGQPIITAIGGAAGQSYTDYWTPYVVDLITNYNLPFGWNDIEDAAGHYVFDTNHLTDDQRESASSVSYNFRIDDLSAAMLRTIIDDDHLTDDMTLSHKITWKDTTLEMNALKQEMPDAVEQMVEASECNGGLKMDVSLADLLSSDKFRVLSLLSAPVAHLDEYHQGGFDTVPHPGYGTAKLVVAVTKDKEWAFPTPNVATNGGYGPESPVFYSAVSVEGPGLADAEFIDYGPLGGYLMQAQCLGVTPVDYTVRVSATCTSGVFVSGSRTYTVGPVKGYRMQYEPESLSNPMESRITVSSQNGVFTLPVSANSSEVLAQFFAVYDVTEEDTEEDGEETETVYYDRTSSLSQLLLVP
ncbi:MAG: hypothetical protein ACOC2L_02225, partial [Candidatus Sumerlaeota bacterium]